MGICIFCQKDRKLTKEHIWSDWIGVLLGETEEYTIHSRKEAEEPRKWKTIGLDHVVRLVCAECNNRWMSDLEREAKRLLSDYIKFGASFSFLPSGIAVLAAYAFKCAIISDNQYRERKPFFTVSERVEFMRHLTIPKGIQMWIASSGDKTFNGHFSSFQFNVGAPNGPLRSSSFFSFTWASGFLIFQVLAVRWKQSHEDPGSW